MTLLDKIQIGCAPGAVWQLIKDPLVMRSWNLRIREIVPTCLGEPRAGSRYRVRYELGGKVSNFEAEIMEFQEPLRLVLHLSGGGLPKGGYIQEVYELSVCDGGTFLKQNIEVYGSGMGIVRRLTILFIHRLARPAGRRYLLKLKDLVEAGNVGAGGISVNGNSVS